MTGDSKHRERMVQRNSNSHESRILCLYLCVVSVWISSYFRCAFLCRSFLVARSCYSFESLADGITVAPLGASSGTKYVTVDCERKTCKSRTQTVQDVRRGSILSDNTRVGNVENIFVCGSLCFPRDSGHRLGMSRTVMRWCADNVVRRNSALFYAKCWVWYILLVLPLLGRPLSVARRVLCSLHVEASFWSVFLCHASCYP